MEQRDLRLMCAAKENSDYVGVENFVYIYVLKIHKHTALANTYIYMFVDITLDT